MSTGYSFKEVLEIMSPNWQNLSESAQGCSPSWLHQEIERKRTEEQPFLHLGLENPAHCPLQPFLHLGFARKQRTLLTVSYSPFSSRVFQGLENPAHCPLQPFLHLGFSRVQRTLLTVRCRHFFIEGFLGFRKPCSLSPVAISSSSVFQGLENPAHCPLQPFLHLGSVGFREPCRPSTTTKLTILTIFFHIRIATTFKLTIFFHPWVVITSKLTIFFHLRVVTTSKLTIFFHLRVVTTSKLTIFFHPRVVTTSKLTIFFHPRVVTTSGHHLVQLVAFQWVQIFSGRRSAVFSFQFCGFEILAIFFQNSSNFSQTYIFFKKSFAKFSNSSAKARNQKKNNKNLASCFLSFFL